MPNVLLIVSKFRLNLFVKQYYCCLKTLSDIRRGLTGGATCQQQLGANLKQEVQYVSQSHLHILKNFMNIIK